jgi:uncharacterized protein (DUF2235 family)
MQTITSSADLKEAIQLLEVERDAKGKQLKVHFNAAYETFSPVNLLKSTLHSITSSPNLIDNVLGTTLGLAAGLASNVLFKGMAGPGLRKVISPALQSGVASFVAKNTGSLRSMGEMALLRIFRNKRVKPRSRAD